MRSVEDHIMFKDIEDEKRFLHLESFELFRTDPSTALLDL